MRHLVERSVVFVAAVSVVFLASLLPVFGWLHRVFSWRTARRALIGVACLVALYALFCTEENIRQQVRMGQVSSRIGSAGRADGLQDVHPQTEFTDEQSFAGDAVDQVMVCRSNNVNIGFEYWKRNDNYGLAEVSVADSQTKGDSEIGAAWILSHGEPPLAQSEAARLPRGTRSRQANSTANREPKLPRRFSQR